MTNIATAKSPPPAVSGLSPYIAESIDSDIRLKLDANEGRVPAIDLATLDLDQMNRYPTPANLQNKLAAKFDLPAESVLITAGGDEAIDRVCRAFLDPGRNLIFPTPSFTMIEKYSQMAGGDVRSIAWQSHFPVDEIIQAADQNTTVVAVVSPNNPTGQTVSRDELQRLAIALPDCILIVDQAYAEFEDNDHSESLTDFALAQIPNAVVIRTFSKAWGLAGLRIGYAMSQKSIIDQLRCVGGPFPVSTFSALAAEQALESSGAKMKEYIQQVQFERDQLAALFDQFGISTRQSQGNFVFLNFDGFRFDAELAYTALKAQGILVRLLRNLNSIRMTCPGNANDFALLVEKLNGLFAPQCVLFDMDGVLVDEAPSYREAIRLTCMSFGQEVPADEIARLKLCGNANNDWVFTQNLLKDCGIDADFETVKQRFEEIYQGVGDTPGVWDRELCLVDSQWLRQLAARFPLGIATGRPRGDAIRFLDNQGIADCFSAIVCMEDGPSKPDPANVQTALKRIGVASAWMIGDTPDDAGAAVAAGINAVGIIAPADDPEFAAKKLIDARVCKIVKSLKEFGDLLP